MMNSPLFIESTVFLSPFIVVAESIVKLQQFPRVLSCLVQQLISGESTATAMAVLQ